MRRAIQKLLAGLLFPLDWFVLNLGELVHFLSTYTIHRLIWRAGVQVEGRANLPTAQAYIIVSSHCLPMAAEYDIIKFIPARRVKPWTIAAQPVAAKFGFLQNLALKGWRHYHPGTILVEDGAGLLTNAVYHLQKGVINWVAPEGIRNYGVGLLRGGVGIAKLMVACPQYPVVPTAVVNEDEIKFVRDLFKPHPDLCLKIGKPFLLANPTPNVPRTDLVAIADEVMRRIALLMPPKKRGYYKNDAEKPFKFTIEQ